MTTDETLEGRAQAAWEGGHINGWDDLIHFVEDAAPALSTLARDLANQRDEALVRAEKAEAQLVQWERDQEADQRRCESCNGPLPPTSLDYLRRAEEAERRRDVALIQIAELEEDRAEWVNKASEACQAQRVALERGDRVEKKLRELEARLVEYEAGRQQWKALQDGLREYNSYDGPEDK